MHPLNDFLIHYNQVLDNLETCHRNQEALYELFTCVDMALHGRQTEKYICQLELKIQEEQNRKCEVHCIYRTELKKDFYFDKETAAVRMNITPPKEYHLVEIMKAKEVEHFSKNPPKIFGVGPTEIKVCALY